MSITRARHYAVLRAQNLKFGTYFAYLGTLGSTPEYASMPPSRICGQRQCQQDGARWSCVQHQAARLDVCYARAAKLGRAGHRARAAVLANDLRDGP